MNVLRMNREFESTSQNIESDAMQDTAYNLYQENYFREMLYLECCRVERSQRNFLLVLLDISSIGESNSTLDFKKQLVHSLNSATREIDIKGWYKKDKVIGIIFFTMSLKDQELIHKKVTDSFTRTGLQSSPLFDNIVIEYHSFPDKDNTFTHDITFNTDLFCEMLYIERRRAERSDNPFLLLLLNLGKVKIKENNSNFVKKITEALDSTTREVDLKGWYKHDQIIGVIFTAMSTKDIDVINEKVESALEAYGVTSSPHFQNVQITYHPFPEESHTYKKNVEFDPELYKDLESKKSKEKPLLYLKRAIDIIGSLVAILIFLPAFLIIPILIKLTSKGPVLFKQKRVGAFGKPFTFLKFRSMNVNNDEKIHMDYIKNLILEEKAYSEKEGNDDNTEKTYKIKDDPRVTKIGKFIRKTSLDEIPQFFNVLLGEMSLVGPRPPIPYELESYDLWHLRRILEFKPGITGIWQVKGRSKTTFNDMVRMDIHYINNWSLLGDIKLIVMTPLSMLLPKDGAY